MRVSGSKNSLQNVQSIARALLPRELSVAVGGILGVVPVPPPLGERPDRLLYAIRTSFERLFQPNRHWNRFSHITSFHPYPFCFHFPNPSPVNPFASVHAAYTHALEKLEAVRKPLGTAPAGNPDRDGIAHMKEGFALSRSGEVQSLFSEADRLFHSANPTERLRANQVKLKALQLFQMISQLIHQAHWIRTSY